MLNLKDVDIAVYLDNGREKYELTSLMQVMNIKTTESAEILLPFGQMHVNDSMNFFNEVQLIGGESLIIFENNKGKGISYGTKYKVLYVEVLGNKNYLIHFALEIPLFENKKSRSFTQKLASEVVSTIITTESKIVDKEIEKAYPRINWVQPYVSDGEFLCYLSSKAYFSENLNYYTFFNREGKFYFVSYENKITKPIQLSFQIANPDIENDKYMEVISKLGVKQYFFDIESNTWTTKELHNPSKDISAFSLKKNSSKDFNTIGSSVVNNFTKDDLEDIDMKTDTGFIKLKYRIHDILSPIDIFEIVNLDVKAKELDPSEDISINQFYSGSWVVGQIEREYSQDTTYKVITFFRKGVNEASDRARA